MSYTRRTWAEIDLAALKHNFDYIRRCAGSSEIMAVVKADAYGHGTENTVLLLDRFGAECFAVSNVDEASELREMGIKKPILILGYTPSEETERLINGDITQAVFSLDYAKEISNKAQKCGKKVKAFLKLDTGMGRIGFNCREEALPEIDDAITAAKLPFIDTKGVFMHFSVSDRDRDSEDGFTDRQYSLFCAAKKRLADAGINVVSACCNSAAILNDKEKNSGICRPGIILYGLNPDNSDNRYPELVPVMTLKSVVSQVKTIKKGETVSYGRTFTADKDMTVATVCSGYGDGYPRALSNKGFVFVKGNRAPIIGRVCMDQFIINADGLDLEAGDEVELFGKNLPVSELARLTDTINYEIVCQITKRVPRITVNGDKI